MENGKTILFVDDDLDMLEIGGIILKNAGYGYIPATSGEQGLSYLVAKKPNLVILDYMMPAMNGFEFFCELRRNHKYQPVRETPVIMLTAASENDVDRKKLFELGLSAFLLKPFGNRELLNVIDNVFILDDLRVRNKELKEQVKRSEYKYQDLIENASDLIFTLDLQANFVFINRRLSTTLQRNRDDWIGRSFFEMLAPRDRESARSHITKALQGLARIFEISIVSDLGKRVYFSINMNPIFERGQIVGCVAIARDITEKKQLGHEIVELKNFNESIIQSMGSGLITVDLEQKVTSFNNSAEDILGYSEIEVVGKELGCLFSKDACEKLLSTIDEPEQNLLNREMEVTAKDGNEVYIGFTVTPRIDTQSRRVGAIISFKDITQIKQMQAEVQRMDRLASMGVLASGIAHEIRNPLAGIKTIAQTLEEEIEPDDSKREYVSRIVRQVNRMDDLLKTIFSYAKPRKPKKRFHQFPEIIQEVVALVENRIRAQSVNYLENYHSDLPPVHVDFYQMQQVFVNLFLNALDAMPEGGDLKLEAYPRVTTLRQVDRRGRTFPVKNKSSLYTEVCLTDSGVGILPDNLGSIFNPFFTTKPHGSGLGLSIVYRIVT
ncbi:MAG: PAS domain S-box protein, partial [bacterium]